MNEGKRLIKNTVIIAIGNISTKIVSFILLPLYTSLLSTSEYGIQDYIESLTLFCVPFITLLMDEAVFRFLIDCKTDDEKKKVISLSVEIVFCGLLVFLFIAIPILMITKYVFSVFFILYVFSAVLCAMVNALLRGMGNIEGYTLYNFILSAMKILLSVILVAILRKGIYGLLISGIMSSLLSTAMFIVKNKMWCYIEFNKVDKTKITEMIKYAIPLIPNKLSWTIINLSDRILIMNIIGSDASGLYAISYKFPTLMDTIYGFFYQSWKESSARVMQDKNANNFYNTVYDNLKRLMGSLVMIMTAFMPIVFKMLIDDSFSEAITFVPILLLATYFANISGFYGGIFTAYKDTKVMGVTTICAAIINILINILFISKFGLFAASFSTLIANYVAYYYRKVKVKKYVKLDECFRSNMFYMVFLTVVFVLFYTEKPYFQMTGGIVALLFSFFYNKKIIILLLKKIQNGD